MLRSFKTLRGLAIRATDGRIGTVSDVYFDDRSWRVRYCVVDTGGWLAGSEVLIGPRSLSVLDFARRELWVRLSKGEVNRGRKAGSDKPVSKQGAPGVTTSIRRLVRSISADRRDPATALPDDHLRSCSAIIGHRLTAIDGQVGEVDDFLIDDKGWTVRELIVDTGHRHPAESARILVGSQKIREINWPNSTVSVDVTREEILAAPTYTAMPGDMTVPVLPAWP